MIWLLVGAALVMVSILITPLSSRIGMPVLLLFLGVGMFAGAEGPGQIIFNDVNTAFLVGNLALAVILLDGGMRTKIESFRVGLRPALLLSTLGIVITATVGGLLACWLFELPLLFGLLIGAIISSTDAAAVFSLLQGRGLTLNQRVAATLEIESGSNDPMAIFLTLMLIGLIQDGDNNIGSAILLFVQQFGFGAIAGLLGGRIMAGLLNRVSLVPAMYPLLVVTSGVTVFSATNLIHGSGFLAVYLMGMVLANRKVRMMPSILQIHDGLAWLAQVILFLLLGLLVTPSQLLESAPLALALALGLILVARPLSTVLSLLPFGFSRREHIFIGWVGLRGAVPIVLALFPFMAGLPGASLIFEVTFVVVLVSLILQGSTLALLARKLKLEVPKVREFKRRVDLDQPAAGDHELVLVPLRGKRWEHSVQLKSLHLPARTQIGAVFRHGELAAADGETVLMENDLIAVFAHETQIAGVNSLLDGKERPERLTERRFFGDFLLEGHATFGDLQAVYGFTVDRFGPEKTLAECFADAQHGHPVVGDRLDLGNILLTAKVMEGDLVTKVGLKVSRDD